MPTIIVDSRESRSGLVQELQYQKCEVISQELECGDYVLAEGFGVERKAASDFVLSILDRRLFSQAPLLKLAYPRRCMIVVEGDVHNTRSAITAEALAGAMSWLSVIEGIPVMTTQSVVQTAQLLITMQRHAVEGLGYEIALRGGKPKDRTLQSQYLVEGLPGVGPGAARKLLAQFGSAGAVFAASPADLRAVPGIGPKTIQTIKDVLDFDTRAAR